MSAFVETDQQLRGTVLGILWQLLLADLAEVPHVEPPVGAAGGQDGLVVGRPLDLLGRAATRVQLLQRSASLNIRQTAKLVEQHVGWLIVLELFFCVMLVILKHTAEK